MPLKENIIKVSLKLFSVKGSTSKSMTDIISETQTLWREKILFGLSEIKDPVEKIVQLFRHSRYRFLTDKNPAGECVFVYHTVELNDQRTDLAEYVNNGFLRLKGMVRKYLKLVDPKKTLIWHYLPRQDILIFLRI